MSNVTDSMNTYSAKMLDRGVTVMSETRHDACIRLINNAKANNHAACDDDVATIIGLDNIQDGAVVNASGESALLDGSLLPAATQKYTGALSTGDSAEYKAATAQNAAAVLKNGIMKKARNQLTIHRSELEFFIEAASLRLGGDESLAFLDGRLAQTRDYSIDVPRDDSASVADESIEAHIDFLTQLRRSVELGMGGNAADKLLAEKSALQTELLSALDDNDLAGAQAIRNQIATLDEELASMPEGTGTAAAEAARDLASSIKQGMESWDGSGDPAAGVDALSGLLSSNFAAIFPILEDLRDAMAKKRDLDGDNTYNDAIGAIEALISENRDAYNRATAVGLSASEASAIADAYFSGGMSGVRLFDDGLLGGAGGTDAGGDENATEGAIGAGAVRPPGGGADANAGLAGRVTSSAATGADGTTGAADPESLSGDEKSAALILTLGQYATELGDESLNGLMRAEANKLLDAGSASIFESLRESGTEYLPARVVAEQLRMRYVWNKNLNGGALARGGTYRFYTVYSTEILMGKGNADVDYMTYPAAYKGELYLPSDYTYDAFGIWCESVPGTTFSVSVSGEVNNCAAELLGLLLGAAGS
jgi:hypothetical protein